MIGWSLLQTNDAHDDYRLRNRLKPKVKLSFDNNC